LIEDLRSSNPGAVTVKDTGKTLSFCSSDQSGSGGGNTGGPLKKKPLK
jgi:hypothetical protein